MLLIIECTLETKVFRANLVSRTVFKFDFPGFFPSFCGNRILPLHSEEIILDLRNVMTHSNGMKSHGNDFNKILSPFIYPPPPSKQELLGGKILCFLIIPMKVFLRMSTLTILDNVEFFYG